MGKKPQAQKEVPPRKNAEGSSRTTEPPVTNPQPAAAAVAPASTVPHQPTTIPANAPPQVVSEPSVPISQVVDLLKLVNPGVDWGMAMAAMGLTARNPPVTTVTPNGTVPTPTITSPTPITENPNQPPNRAVEPEIPKPSSPEKINPSQMVLDVSPVAVYEPPTNKPMIDEYEGGEKGERDEGGEEGEEDEGGEEGDKEKGEGKEEGVEKTDLEEEGEKAKVREETEKEVVDETCEKEKLMTAEEFEEIMDGVRPVRSKKDDSVKSVDIGIEKTEDPDNVEEGNLSEEKAEGGEESEREVDPLEKDEGGKERKNTKRKLILETTEETQGRRDCRDIK